MNPNFQQQLAELIQHNQQNPNNQMFFLINGTNDNFLHYILLIYLLL